MNGDSERSLAAVWFADLVGYTAVSSTDEARALELVEILQRAAGTVVAEARGRIVKFLGDAVLSEFPSTEAALDSALELIRRFRAATQERGRSAQLRVGLHLGELTRSPDGDIYGDVVNTAARLQHEAEPDQVLVSEDAWRVLRHRPSFRFDEGGARRLKGKEEPLRTYVASRRFGASEHEDASRPVSIPEEAAEGQRRLVVLPFQVLRPDAEVEFLAFGLPDAVSSSLMGLNSLVVRSPPAVPENRRADPREVARRASVDLVLSGTVQRVGDQVRVSAQLAEGRHGTLLWSETATRTIGDLFELQDDLTRRIVASLSRPLTAEEERRVSRDVPASGEAYELYLRANRAAVAGHQWMTGVELYRAALELDPDFAPAWARLGRSYRLQAKYGERSARQDRYRELAEEAFERALELNPDLALGHSLYAQLEVESGRPIEGMVRLLRRAARHPSEVDLFVGLTHACRYCSLLRASLGAHARAVALDPDVRTSVTYTYLQIGDAEAALRASPSNDPASIYALQSLGRTDEARARFEDQVAGSDLGVFEPFIRTVFAAGDGDREAALTHGRRAVEGFPDPEGRYFIGRCWTQVGADDEALEVIHGVVADGFHCAGGLSTDPLFSSLRGTPAFGALLERADAGRAAALEAFRREHGAVVLGMEGAP